MVKSSRWAVKIFSVAAILLASIQFISAIPAEMNEPAKEMKSLAISNPVVEYYNSLYTSLDLAKLKLSGDAWASAIKGFTKMQMDGVLSNSGILSVVDFSLPSDKKRLFIIDMINGKLLFHTYAAHGRNSGREMATTFSNRKDSYMSSLGFYITGSTYRGEHGYSLKLMGMEKGINDNAYDRKIVVHGAKYVSEKNIASLGYLGRSLGCPAVPQSLHKPIIEKIRNGTCLFLFGPDPQYTAFSPLLRADSLS